MIHGSLDTGRALDAGPNVGLARQPSDQPFGCCVVFAPLGLTIRSQHKRELGCGPSNVRQPALQKSIGQLAESNRVVWVDVVLRQDILFQAVEPTVDDRTGRPARIGQYECTRRQTST